MFQCFRFPNIDFEWTGSSASMCEKKHIFSDPEKIFFFATPDFILQGLIPQPLRGFATFLPIPQSQSKNNLISHQRAHSISFPCNPRKKGSFAFISRGECEKNNFSEPEKLYFLQSRVCLCLSYGLVWGQRKRSCNISFLSLTRPVPKRKIDRVVFFAVLGLTPAIPAKRFIPFHSARGMRKDNFSEPKNCFSAKPDSSVSSAMVSRSFLATAVLLFTG